MRDKRKESGEYNYHNERLSARVKQSLETRIGENGGAVGARSEAEGGS